MSASNIELVTKVPVGGAAVSAAAISGRTRLYGIYYTCTATASSFEIRNGAADTATSLLMSAVSCRIPASRVSIWGMGWTLPGHEAG